jgi:hypothetical protein
MHCELLTVSLDEVAALDHEVLDHTVELAALVALRQPALPASSTYSTLGHVTRHLHYMHFSTRSG